MKYLLHLDGLRCFGEFPLLERHPRNDKRHGDVCRTMYTKNWRCPKGCFKVKRGKSPFCKMWRKHKSTVCRVERGILIIKCMIFCIFFLLSRIIYLQFISYIRLFCDTNGLPKANSMGIPKRKT